MNVVMLILKIFGMIIVLVEMVDYIMYLISINKEKKGFSTFIGSNVGLIARTFVICSLVDYWFI